MDAAAGADENAGRAGARERPWIYGLLIAPSAMVGNGVIQGGVLAYLLSQQGVGSGAQARLIFLLGLPTSLYFLWSPVTDFFVRRRTWLLVGGLVSAVLMALAFRAPQLSSREAFVLMLLSACCSQLVVASCGGMLGAIASERGRRRAGSFYQAGSMGFGALGAWLLIRESSRVAPATLGLLAAGLIGVPSLFALVAPRQEVVGEEAGLGATMGRVWAEARATFFRWEALPYALCMLAPGGTGAAAGLIPGVANQYGVSGDSVAWMNGLLGGLLMAAGSAVMALVVLRMRATVMYMAVNLVNCAMLAVLSFGPMNARTYLLGTTLYLFTTGCCYAAFTAVVLEFLGASGKSGSMRYSIINSLGNVPVLYMLRVDGWGGDHFGGRGVAGAECVVGAVGSVMLLGWFLMKGAERTKR